MLPLEVVRSADGSWVLATRVLCLNRVRLRFGLVGEGNVHPFRRRPGTGIYCCSECGSQSGLDRLSS